MEGRGVEWNVWYLFVHHRHHQHSPAASPDIAASVIRKSSLSVEVLLGLLEGFL